MTSRWRRLGWPARARRLGWQQRRLIHHMHKKFIHTFRTLCPSAARARSGRGADSLNVSAPPFRPGRWWEGNLLLGAKGCLLRPAAPCFVPGAAVHPAAPPLDVTAFEHALPLLRLRDGADARDQYLPNWDPDCSGGWADPGCCDAAAGRCAPVGEFLSQYGLGREKASRGSDPPRLPGPELLNPCCFPAPPCSGGISSSSIPREHGCDPLRPQGARHQSPRLLGLEQSDSDQVPCSFCPEPSSIPIPRFHSPGTCDTPRLGPEPFACDQDPRLSGPEYLDFVHPPCLHGPLQSLSLDGAVSFADCHGSFPCPGGRPCDGGGACQGFPREVPQSLCLGYRRSVDPEFAFV